MSLLQRLSNAEAAADAIASAQLGKAWDLSVLTDAELRMLRAIAIKATRGGSAAAATRPVVDYDQLREDLEHFALADVARRCDGDPHRVAAELAAIQQQAG